MLLTALSVFPIMPRSATTRVYSVTSHSRRSGNSVELEVQPACVADHLAARITPPYCCGVCATVATG